MILVIKILKKKQARILRQGGESIRQIAKRLKVSPSSASMWCRDIELSQEQTSELKRRHIDPEYGKRKDYHKKVRKERMDKEKKLYEQGIKEIGNISKRELFLTGIALYWAEGFKKDSRVGFASMDPAMINFFIRWLKECFNYSNEDLKLAVTANISHKYRIHEIQNYWSKQTGIPVEDFNKPFFQNVKWILKYDKPEDYYGVLRIRVKKSIELLRKMRGWIDGLNIDNLNQ